MDRKAQSYAIWEYRMSRSALLIFPADTGSNPHSYEETFSLDVFEKGHGSRAVRVPEFL